MANDPSVVSKYIAGFNECTNEVTKYLGSVDGLTPDMKNRLMGHLADCLQRQFTANQSIAGANQNVGAHQSLGLQIPSATQLNALPGAGGVCVLSPGNMNPPIQTIPTSPMQLVPAKLPSGDLVFLLTNPSHMSTASGVPVVSALSTQASAQQPVINIAPNQQVAPTTPVAVAGVSSSPTVVFASNHLELNNNNSKPSSTVVSACSSTAVKEETADTVSSTSAQAEDVERCAVLAVPVPEHFQAPEVENVEEEEEDRINNNGDVGVEGREGPMWRPWWFPIKTHTKHLKRPKWYK